MDVRVEESRGARYDPWMGSTVADGELRAALDAIAARHPDADVLVRGVAHAYASDELERRLVHLDADVRAEVEPGRTYVTWVVTFVRGEVVDVDAFVSRACASR